MTHANDHNSTEEDHIASSSIAPRSAEEEAHEGDETGAVRL